MPQVSLYWVKMSNTKPLGVKMSNTKPLGKIIKKPLDITLADTANLPTGVYEILSFDGDLKHPEYIAVTTDGNYSIDFGQIEEAEACRVLLQHHDRRSQG